MIEQPPIFITGIPRSGTTMIARVINACGVFAGGGVTQKNSMFENVNINKMVVRPYMERMGTDPLGQFPLPNLNDLSIPLTWRNAVEGILTEVEGYIRGPWMYKDTKMSLIWPVWNNAFPNAKWIIVRRRTGDIVQSCLKTGYMKAYETESGWLEWIHEYEKRFVGMIEAGVNCKILWPERMMTGDLAQLNEVINWLGITWRKEALSFIDPLLWGNKQKERSKK